MAMHPGPYYVGATVNLEAEFSDQDGVAVNPDEITLRLKGPDGVTTTHAYLTSPSIGQSATGAFYCTVTPDRGGRYFFRWETVDPAAVKEGNFLVQHSEFVEG